jgi:predicted aspartyl protease
MRSIRTCAGALAAACLSLGAGTGAQATCQLQTVAQFPIVLNGNTAEVAASINGRPVRFLLDSGAGTTTITRNAAEALQLPTHPTDDDFYGVGGSEKARITTLHELKIGDFAARDIRMMVVGSGFSGVDYVGLFGGDFLFQADVELDFADRVVRLFKPKGCQGDEVVYWNKPYSTAEIVGDSSHALNLYVTLNGHKVLAQLDTGSDTSIVTSGAAQTAGVTPRSQGVQQVDATRGIGPAAIKTYTAVFPALSVGDETIHNAELRLGDIFDAAAPVPFGTHIPRKLDGEPEMLLGFDFVKAHRIYVARSQGKIYFSYNGGPIFQTETPSAEKAAPATDAPKTP